MLRNPRKGRAVGTAPDRARPTALGDLGVGHRFDASAATSQPILGEHETVSGWAPSPTGRRADRADSA